jgi:hypothetical protein
MMEIASRVVLMMTRGESCLFFSFFIDYLIVSHNSGLAGQKWLYVWGRGREKEGAEGRLKREKEKRKHGERSLTFSTETLHLPLCGTAEGNDLLSFFG